MNIFQRNIDENCLRAVVRTLQSDSADVAWDMPIGMLVRGLHDNSSVAREFHHFEKWLLPGGFVAFRDYADDENIRYVRLPVKRTMGDKHNLGCELARGEVISCTGTMTTGTPIGVSPTRSKSLRGNRRRLCAGCPACFSTSRPAAGAWEYVYPPGGKPWLSGGTPDF